MMSLANVPSSVSTSKPLECLSRRPQTLNRGRSTTSPVSSDKRRRALASTSPSAGRLLTYPPGLFSTVVRFDWCRRRTGPVTRTSEAGSAFAPSTITSPFTDTSPVSISASASRRLHKSLMASILDTLRGPDAGVS